MTRAESLKKRRSHADAIKALGATSLYLFGSTARNKANAKSDLDLLVDVDPRGRFSVLDLVAAKRCLKETSASKSTSCGPTISVDAWIICRAVKVDLPPLRAALLALRSSLK